MAPLASENLTQLGFWVGSKFYLVWSGQVRAPYTVSDLESVTQYVQDPNGSKWTQNCELLTTWFVTITAGENKVKVKSMGKRKWGVFLQTWGTKWVQGPCLCLFFLLCLGNYIQVYLDQVQSFIFRAHWIVISKMSMNLDSKSNSH